MAYIVSSCGFMYSWRILRNIHRQAKSKAMLLAIVSLCIGVDAIDFDQLLQK